MKKSFEVNVLIYNLINNSTKKKVEKNHFKRLHI